MAVSALRSSRPDSSPSIGNRLMPMLAVTWRRVPLMKNVGFNASNFFCASMLTSAASATSFSRITNSSPPKRAMVSRELLQQVVASFVPEGIVDVLDAVEVEEHHCDQTVVPARIGQRLLQTVEKQRAVRQLGEHVVMREEL